MTSTKLLTELRRIEADFINDNKSGVYLTLQNLIAEVEGEIRDEYNTEAGKGSVAKAAERILKSASYDPREAFHKAYRSKKGLLICDGFRAVRFNLDNAPSLVEHPGRYDYPDIDGIIDGPKDITEPLRMPTLGELRAHIKTEKARLKAKMEKGVRLILTDGAGLEIHVDAQFLLDMLEALPGATVRPARRNVATSALYFKAENGDGVLLPLRQP